MIVFSYFILIGLLAISAIHFAWALGSTFPAKDEINLAKTVAGFKEIQKMPPRLASAAVALVTFISAFWPLLMEQSFGEFLPRWFLLLGAIALALIFCFRGGIGFTSAWRKITPEQPFSILDRKYYSPFCLALGFAFVALILWGKL